MLAGTDSYKQELGAERGACEMQGTPPLIIYQRYIKNNNSWWQQHKTSRTQLKLTWRSEEWTLWRRDADDQ